MNKNDIAPARGRVGVLLPGLGAVATTVVAGVEAVRRGLAQPIGSLTQMNTIRLGKRTDERTPLIRELVDLAGLDQLVFGGWDPIPDDAYDSAVNAGVLDRGQHLDPIRDFLRSVKPMPPSSTPPTSSGWTARTARRRPTSWSWPRRCATTSAPSGPKTAASGR